MMNISNITYKVDVLAENPWAPIGSLVPYGVGWIVSARWMNHIWKDIVNPSKTWNIFNILHAWIKIMVGFIST